MKTIQEYTSEHVLLIEQLLRDRLYNKGTYFDDKPIKTYGAASGVYSPFTQKIKKVKGQPTDRVTLHDTGEFYETFAPQFETSGFAIEYDENKPDGKISDNVPDLKDAITLSEENLEQLRQPIKIDIQNDFLQEAREAVLYGLR